MKQVLIALILSSVFVNAFAWGHRASSGSYNTSHSFGGRTRR
jgi:hypothetical protein